jgi:hypothetical protein
MPITKTDIETMPPNNVIWDAGKGSVSGFGVRRQRALSGVRAEVQDRQTPALAHYRQVRLAMDGRSGAARGKARVGLGRWGRGLAAVARGEPTAVTTMAMLCDRYMVAAKAGSGADPLQSPEKGEHALLSTSAGSNATSSH